MTASRPKAVPPDRQEHIAIFAKVGIFDPNSSGFCHGTQRSDGALLALFESPYWLERLKSDNPELVLDRLIAEG